MSERMSDEGFEKLTAAHAMDRLSQCNFGWLIDERAKVRKLEATIARVEANIKLWDEHSADVTERLVVNSFRAALSDKEPEHVVGTCMKCGEEMRYNVPRLGSDGGFVHKDTGSLDCRDELENKQ